MSIKYKVCNNLFFMLIFMCVDVARALRKTIKYRLERMAGELRQSRTSRIENNTESATERIENLIMNMSMWRNRYTRTFEGRVERSLRVQVPPSTP